MPHRYLPHQQHLTRALPASSAYRSADDAHQTRTACHMLIYAQMGNACVVSVIPSSPLRNASPHARQALRARRAAWQRATHARLVVHVWRKWTDGVCFDLRANSLLLIACGVIASRLILCIFAFQHCGRLSLIWRTSRVLQGWTLSKLVFVYGCEHSDEMSCFVKTSRVSHHVSRCCLFPSYA